MPFPVETLDLELAWRRVKNDLAIGRVFVQSPYEVDLVEADEAEWLKRLEAKIAAGYRPHSAVVADIPKGNGAVRPAALLCLEDRVVYSAAVGAILPAINAGLRWSQGIIDFSYRLSESPRRVEWFTNTFNSWSAFRQASIKRVDDGAAHVVLTDLTGFYENIELDILLSDLRALGCDAAVIQLLQTCLYRWCIVSGRGVPQGLSPSDVLAKVYLNRIDQALIDAEIDYIRYVDDIRLFCADVPASKKALMFLIQALRRRGLNLQTSKTLIVSASDARSKFDGITPVIAAVQERYREFLIAMMESVGPYATITELEENVSPDDAPVEIVRETFQKIFIDGEEPFNKTLFHYLLNRLGAQRDPYAIDYCLGLFASHPQETSAILEYCADIGEGDKVFAALEQFLTSNDSIYDYQIYEMFEWISTHEASPTDGLLAIARRMAFDNARPAYLRAVCRILLQNFGTMADIELLEDSYAGVHEELEKAQVLVSIKRREVGRRNAFYGRVAGDGLLCGRAVSLVKQGRL